MKKTFEFTKKIEVTLPHYRKNNFYFYKIISEDGYGINVGILPDGANMFAKVEFEKQYPQVVFSDKTEEITAEEFNEAFANALVLIQSKNV
jgi:hypothetical protein